MKPQIKTFSYAPSIAIMDGDEGLGFVVGYRATQEAAKELGVEYNL